MSNELAITSDADLKAAMQESGLFNTAQPGIGTNRLKMTGNNLMLGDDIIASYNAKTQEPAAYVQILSAPKEMQSMYFEPLLADFVGRSDIANHYCRSHYDNPAENRKFAEDGTECESCPVNPYTKYEALPAEALAQQGASKCSWKGEIEFRILDKQDDGTLAAKDETVYMLTLSTTGMIEWQGSLSRNSNQMEGKVSQYNTKVRLAQLGLKKYGKEGIAKAAEALRLGGVIAELRLLPASNKEKGWNYNVPSFNPIEILEVTEAPALSTAEEAPDATSALPF